MLQQVVGSRGKLIHQLWHGDLFRTLQYFFPISFCLRFEVEQIDDQVRPPLARQLPWISDACHLTDCIMMPKNLHHLLPRWEKCQLSLQYTDSCTSPASNAQGSSLRLHCLIALHMVLVPSFLRFDIFTLFSSASAKRTLYYRRVDMKS